MVLGLVGESPVTSLLISALPLYAETSERVSCDALSVLRYIRGAMADSQDKQKEQTDAKQRKCIDFYEVVYQVLLNAKNLPTNVVSSRSVFKTNLLPRFIGPFTVLAKKGLSYIQSFAQNAPTPSVVRWIA